MENESTPARQSIFMDLDDAMGRAMAQYSWETITDAAEVLERVCELAWNLQRPDMRDRLHLIDESTPMRPDMVVASRFHFTMHWNYYLKHYRNIIDAISLR